MEGKSILLLCICIPLLFYESSAQLTFNTSLSGTVYETAPTRTNLVCVGCTDASPTVPPAVIRVNKVGITNQFTCGSCFDVFTGLDTKSANGEWCVFFLPSQGNLNYALAPSYTMSVRCENGQDPPVTTDVLIQVLPNEPPVVTNPTDACIIPNTLTKGATVYNNLRTFITDPNGDNTFCSMTASPPSTNYVMDPVTCQIRTTKDLLTSECNKAISFLVNVTDTFSNAVGPVRVECTITSTTPTPDVVNLNTSTFVLESALNNAIVYTIQTNPTPVVPRPTYTITGINPPQLTTLFFVDIDQNGIPAIRLRGQLDYEHPLQQGPIVVSMDASFQNCPLGKFFLIINVSPVNEPPVLAEDIVTLTVNEESIFVDPVLNCRDPDLGDTCTYRIKSGNPTGRFRINPDTGIISGVFDIDPNQREVNVTMVIEVSDRDGLTDNATVILNIKDINDNKPTFVDRGLTNTINECTGPGLLNAFRATDNDSDFRSNNIFSFVPKSSDCLQIQPDGSVYLKRAILVPEICVLSTRVVDHGEFPGPLTSQVEATITVGTGPCPPTPAPVTAAGGGAGATAAASVTVAATTAVVTVTNATLVANVAGANTDLIFGILGGILGALLLATLLACCCRRFCGKKKTAPFSSDQTASKNKKKFDAIKKKKAKSVAAAAAVPAAVVAPNLVQRFLRVRRKIPLMRVKRRVPVQTVRQLVPINNGQFVQSAIPAGQAYPPVRSAPGSVRQVLPAPPQYRLSGSAPLVQRPY